MVNKTEHEDASLLNSLMMSTTEYTIIVLDLQGTILSWNEGATRKYGYSAPEACGKHSSILNIPEDIHSGLVNKFFCDALNFGRAEDVFERRKKDGEHFTAAVTLTLRKNAKGKPIGYVLISKDITEQKKLELQLRVKNIELEQQNLRVQQANRLKSEFVANMSHELRTPLNAIIGFAEFMHSEKTGPVTIEHKEYLGDILSSSYHLLQLINDILDLSKIEAGKMEFCAKQIDLHKIITEVKNILLTQIAKKHIKFNIEIDTDLKNILIDPGKFKQILYNFISNAIKFSHEEGKITVIANSYDEKFFSLQVKDDGIGIHDNDIEKLFIEFQQLDASTTKKYQGTGLGLALTKRIVEAQGGKVGVKTKLNEGSTFYAILPKFYLSKNTPVDSSPDIPAFTNPNIPAILIIEDDSKERMIIKKCLNNAGYAVDTAANAIQALRLSRLRRYDCIILDLLLPDLNGWEVLKSLRNETLNTNVPVIVLSIVAEKTIPSSYMILDFLNKPLDSDCLLSRLKKSNILPHTPQSILVVDDNFQDLELAKAILNQMGYNVICESNGKKALDHALTNHIDTIILDLLMPDMNGFDFLKEFHQNNKEGKTVVIVWTAKELNSDEKKQLNNSVDTIVTKGKDSTDTLLAKIQHLRLIRNDEKMH